MAARAPKHFSIDRLLQAWVNSYTTDCEMKRLVSKAALSAALAPAPAGPRMAATIAQSGRTVTIAGFPLPAWAFALRIWGAMMVALYAAFWLRLERTSAAVTVGILALQTRGQAYEKALYRIVCTVIGVVASFVIAGLFPQTRELFLIGFAGWLGVCVYVVDFWTATGLRRRAGRLYGCRGRRNADRPPQNIFLAGVNRGAAIVVGIAALALVSDVFAAPNLRTALFARLTAAHRRVRAFALGILRGEADPIQSANLLREITALHPDITALVAESSDGSARSAAAWSAAVALVAEVSAVGALASLPHDLAVSSQDARRGTRRWPRGGEPYLAASPAATCRCRPSRPARRAFRPSRRGAARRGSASARRHRRPRSRPPPSRLVSAPIYRSRRAAVRNGLRAFLAVLISAILFSSAAGRSRYKASPWWGSP